MPNTDRGSLIATLDDGTRIFTNGISPGRDDSHIFIEGSVAVYNFSAQLSLADGDWSAGGSFVTNVDSGSVEIQMLNGDLATKVDKNWGIYKIGVIITETGEVMPVAGLGIGTEWFGGGVGIALDAEPRDVLAENNTLTIRPDGTSVQVEYLPGDPDYPNVKVRITEYDASGNRVGNPSFTNIPDQAMAADLAAGVLSVRNKLQCFSEGTLISLPNNESIEIQDIRPGDLILSYHSELTNGGRALVPSRVTETYQNSVSTLLDFHGTKVTPGHVMLCAEGIYKGKFVPLIDILTSDGAIVDMHGVSIRAATNAKVGSIRDSFVEIEFLERSHDKRIEHARVRVGTLLLRQDGSTVSILECIEAAGMEFDPASGLVSGPDQPPAPLPFAGPPPRPEDYVLRVSGLTLSDIVDDPHGAEHATMRRRVYGETRH